MLYDIKGLIWRMKEIHQEIMNMTTENNEMNFDLLTLKNNLKMMIEKWEKLSEKTDHKNAQNGQFSHPIG